MAEGDDEVVVTMSEYYEGLEAEELEADMVLGGDDGKECTYMQGYLPRQAVFSCLTCVSEGNAGVCTACSITCHDGHEVIELWTRRNFRCDCGNSKFGAGVCKLYSSKDVENVSNVYNENFKGMYCTCKRPYPDPDSGSGEEPGEMLQCCVCEDWFHEKHLGLGASEQIPRDEEGEPVFDELVCRFCVEKLGFLSFYSELLLPPSNIVLLPAVPGDEVVPSLNGNAVNLVQEEKIQGLGKDAPKLKEEEASTNHIASSSEPSKNTGLVCKLKHRYHKGEGEATPCNKPLFLVKDWRAQLCACGECVAMYSDKGVGFLLEAQDSLRTYEEMAKQKREEKKTAQGVAEMDVLRSLGHVGQIEFLHKFNHMTTELSSFFASFRDSGKTVTSEDIHEFFGNLDNKRRRLDS